MNSKRYTVSINYVETLEALGGRLDLLEKPELSDEILAHYVIAPSVVVHDDGSKEIVGWSLINGKLYKDKLDD